MEEIGLHEAFERKTDGRDLGDDAVDSADSPALVAVRRRDELLGEQKWFSVTTDERVDVADVGHVHRELVHLAVRQVALQVDQCPGSTQTLTGRLQPPASTEFCFEHLYLIRVAAKKN